MMLSGAPCEVNHHVAAKHCVMPCSMLQASMSMIKCDLKSFDLFTYKEATKNVAILSTPFLHRKGCNLSLITAIVNLSSSESWIEKKTW